MSPSVRYLLSVVLLAGLVATAFLPGVGAPFFFDDLGSIPGNPHLTDPWSWRAFDAPDQTTAAGRPLVAWSLALNHAVGGLDPRGYHLVNLVLHLCCAWLLWRLLGRLFARVPWLAPGAGPLSLVLAALWAVHPVQTEAVTYVIQRTELMGALFTLGAVHAVVLGATRRGRPGLGGWGALAVVCGLAATLSKETAVALPLLCLCAHRLVVGGSFAATWRRAPLSHGLLFACWIPLALLVAGGPRSASVGFDHGIGPWTWLLTQSQVLIHYLTLTLRPEPLLVSYHWPLVEDLAQVWPALILLSALAVGTVLALRRGRLASLAGVAWFTLLAPSSSVVPIWTEVAAERRVYLPLAAVLCLAAVGLARLLAGRAEAASARRRLAALSLVLVLLAAASLPRSRARAALFGDQRALWAQTVAHQPDHALAWMQLGLAAKREGDLVDAERCLARATTLDPQDHKAQVNLGNVRLLEGRVDQAVQAYQRAAALAPDVPPVQFNLGLGLQVAGDLPGARLAFARCVQLTPWDLAARLHLAEVLLDLGGDAAAATQLDAVLARQPGHAKALALRERLPRPLASAMPVASPAGG